MSSSGTLIGVLWVSCRPIEFYLLRGLDGMRSTPLRLRSVNECAVPPGLAELEQLLMESNSQRSRHLFIPQLHDSLT